MIGLNDAYSYLYGNPVKVHVPVDTAIGGLFIIGAYPSAHFQSVENDTGNILNDVPWRIIYILLAPNAISMAFGYGM